MIKPLQLLIILPLLAFGQVKNKTKWIKRGSLSFGELTLFAASKYIFPEEQLKYDSSFYYQGEFVILAERFDTELFNSDNHLDIFELENEKCLHEEGITFVDLTKELGYTDEQRIILLPINICSDYINGSILQIKSNKIEKLFELDMWGGREILISEVNTDIFEFSYQTEQGSKSVYFNKQTNAVSDYQ